MALLLNPLVKRLITQAAGSAAVGKLSEQAAQMSGQAGPTAEERTHFIIWLRGDFRRRRPEAFNGVWGELQRRERWLESEGALGEQDLTAAVSALTGVWLELRADTAACDAWFIDLGAAGANDFTTLIEALRPRPSELQQRAETLLGAASAQVRKYDPATEAGRRRVADGAKQARAFGERLFNKRTRTTNERKQRG